MSIINPRVNPVFSCRSRGIERCSARVFAFSFGIPGGSLWNLGLFHFFFPCGLLGVLGWSSPKLFNLVAPKPQDPIPYDYSALEVFPYTPVQWKIPFSSFFVPRSSHRSSSTASKSNGPISILSPRRQPEPGPSPDGYYKQKTSVVHNSSCWLGVLTCGVNLTPRSYTLLDLGTRNAT